MPNLRSNICTTCYFLFPTRESNWKAIESTCDYSRNDSLPQYAQLKLEVMMQCFTEMGDWVHQV